MNTNNNKRYFEDGRQALKVASCKQNQNKGVNVIQGKGDHVKVQYKNESIIIPDREIGRGLGATIWKWFMLRGLIVGIVIFGVFNQEFINHFIHSLNH